MALAATGALDVISNPYATPPAHQTQHWHREAEQFRNYIHHELGDHAHRGTNGSGREVPFVCKRALTEYWTRERIKAVLDRDGNTEAHIETIETVCLVVFSILCYISCSDYFNHFTSHLRFNDSGLPVFAFNYPSTDPELRHALARFCEEQWRFIPLDFVPTIHKKRLAADYILPVVYDRTPLATNDGSAVYRVSFDPCCVGEKFKSDANSRNVVFKMLGPEESDRDLWHNEANAYNLLCRSSPNEGRVRGELTHMGNSISIASSFNYITRYLGSFIRTRPPENPRAPGRGHSAPPGRPGPAQHHDVLAAQVGAGPQRWPSSPSELGHVYDADPDPVVGDILEKNHVIILEYARGGNLTDFCQRHSSLITSPDRDDRLDLWHQMFHLLQSLFVIHSANG
jgi:serine/threonine protein kinase